MNRSRRRALRTLSLISAGTIVAGLSGPTSARLLASPRRAGAVGNRLRIPPTIDGGDIVAQTIETTIWPDRPSTVWTLGESFPPPTIRIRRGDPFSARLINQLTEPTNIHWHGLLVPADMDGHPMHLVAPGAERSFAFTIDQPGGTFWYHPHAHGSTAKQIHLGMAGILLVEDDDDEMLGLPSGPFDIPILLQDKRENAERTITYAPSMPDLMTGMIGGTMLANGTPDAYHEVSRDVYRVRLVNASNGRVLALALDDGSTFHQIASDGGLLDRPYPLTELRLGPGERTELLIDFSNREIGSSVRLISREYDSPPDETWQGWGMDIIRFDVNAPAERSFTMPETLRPMEMLTGSMVTVDREISLTAIHQHPSMSHRINGKEYDMNRVDLQIAPGAIERWTFNNVTDEPHPMHIHGALFQVASRTGGPLDARHRGWKDTVVVEPFEQMTILIRFAEHEGLFVAHCHNLEHAETGMMMNVQVGGTMSVGEVWVGAPLDLQ